MLRMTSKKPWKEVEGNLREEMGYSHIWQRLAMLEDVLGDEYNIFELKGMIKREKEASGMKGHRRKGRLTKMIDVNGTQSVIGYVFGGNKVATAEKLGKVDICDLLFRLSEIEDLYLTKMVCMIWKSWKEWCIRTRETVFWKHLKRR